MACPTLATLAPPPSPRAWCSSGLPLMTAQSWRGKRLVPLGASATVFGEMPISFIFRCQFCDEKPDPLTQLNLVKAMRENTWGAYQDALPGRWLVFHGRGLYGSARYACPDHRGDLVAYLREHFGTIGSHVWKRPPYPSSLAHGGTDRAWISATRRKGGGAF